MRRATWRGAVRKSEDRFRELSMSTSGQIQRVLATHAADIEQIVRRYVDDESDRDDLRQEIAIALWNALPRFLGNSSERTYVLRIARNRAISFCLRAARRRALVRPITDDDPAPTPHSGEHDIEYLRVLLAAAVERLSSDQHHVLSLAAAGHSPREIADRTGRTVGAVRVAMHRIRRVLQSWRRGDAGRAQ
jgi:RNA polymerase sigma-70 factor, ECF subfamily